MYVNVHVLFLSGCTCTCMFCILNEVFCILNCECGIEAIVNRMFLKKKFFILFFFFDQSEHEATNSAGGALSRCLLQNDRFDCRRFVKVVPV